jgi:hypothetical protein
MITKRTFIEYVQNRIVGGDATMDVQGVANYAVIEQAVNFVFNDLVSRDRYLAREMGTREVITVASNSGTLSASPMLGTKGIISAIHKGEFLPFTQGLEEATLMNILMPQVTAKSVVNSEGRKINFKGVEGDVEVIYIPNFSDLDEDVPFILESQMTNLYGMVRKVMAVDRNEEVLDNSVSDTAMQPKN